MRTTTGQPSSRRRQPSSVARRRRLSKTQATPTAANQTTLNDHTSTHRRVMTAALGGVSPCAAPVPTATPCTNERSNGGMRPTASHRLASGRSDHNPIAKVTPPTTKKPNPSAGISASNRHRPACNRYANVMTTANTHGTIMSAIPDHASHTRQRWIPGCGMARACPRQLPNRRTHARKPISGYRRVSHKEVNHGAPQPRPFRPAR